MTLHLVLTSLRKDPRLAIGGVLVAIVAWLLVQTFIWRPVRDRFASSSQIDAQVLQVRGQLERADKAAAYCDRMALQSLSSDPLVVAHRYQEWLMKRTEQLGTVSVIPLTPIEEASVGWKVPFTIEGESDIHKVAGLLDEIAYRPLLHRITYFNAQQEERTQNASQKLRFSLTLEAIALANASDQASIPPVIPTKQESQLAAFIKNAEPFSQGYFGPPPSKVSPAAESLVSSSPEKTVPKVDPLAAFTLIGSVEVNGHSQAWVYDQSTKQTIYLMRNEPFEFDTLKGAVLEITSDYIDVSIDDATIRWTMGTALRNAIGGS